MGENITHCRNRGRYVVERGQKVEAVQTIESTWRAHAFLAFVYKYLAKERKRKEAEETQRMMQEEQMEHDRKAAIVAKRRSLRINIEAMRRPTLYFVYKRT